ncbi:MAG: transglutaminase family protein [Flavihumibacter sp.]
MTYHITHTTEYKYHQEVALCHNIARLLPRNTSMQTLRKSTVKISPLPDVMEAYEDFYGNNVLYFAVQEEHSALKVTVQTQIEKKPQPAYTAGLYQSYSWEEALQEVQYPSGRYFDARQFTGSTPMTAFNQEIHTYASRSFTPGRSFFDATFDLIQRIYKDFEYKPGFTSVATPLQEVMELKKGVCQDFAHLAIAGIRSLGLPARYVSGYLETLAPPGKEKLTGVDASHAWLSIFIPDTGWVDFDPTNNMLTGDQHITIGWGRDYADVPPLKGVILSAGPHQLEVSVDVRRV